jgi:hypothetical protein
MPASLRCLSVCLSVRDFTRRFTRRAVTPPCCGQEYGVRGYPTVKWFGENKDAPQDYGGSRDADGLTSFATDQWQAQLPPPEARATRAQAPHEPCHSRCCPACLQALRH